MNRFSFSVFMAAMFFLLNCAGCGTEPVAAVTPKSKSAESIPTGEAKSPSESTSADKSNTDAEKPNFGDPGRHPDPARISNYVRRIFEDTHGRLWLGTNGDGVCCYDGKTLKYYSLAEGFGGVAVRAIVEDIQGNVWFGTERGLTQFDGEKFTNFNQNDGLIHNDVWCLTFDRAGVLWIGTLGGVSKFDGKTFKPFALPDSKPDPSRGVTSAKIVHWIMQDRSDRMWFANNDGAFIFDGKELTNLNETDGLSHNCVNSMLQASDGTVWFATHHKGVCRFDEKAAPGKKFTRYGELDGIQGTEGWDLFEDRDGNIWLTMEHDGVYKFDGTKFEQFHRPQGLLSDAVQCTFQDGRDRIWFGGVYGLFRLEGDSVIAITKDGPW